MNRILYFKPEEPRAMRRRVCLLRCGLWALLSLPLVALAQSPAADTPSDHKKVSELHPALDAVSEIKPVAEDAVLQQGLVGEWEARRTGARLRMIYGGDGRCESDARIFFAKYQFKGTWKVSGGKVFTEVVESRSRSIKVGAQFVDEILEWTGDEVVFRNQKKMVTRFKRLLPEVEFSSIAEGEEAKKVAAEKNREVVLEEVEGAPQPGRSTGTNAVPATGASATPAKEDETSARLPAADQEPPEDKPEADREKAAQKKRDATD